MKKSISSAKIGNNMVSDVFSKYLSEINKAYSRGDATEHTHRPALKSLIEGLAKKITATNEPRRVKCGAPDFLVTRRKRTLDEKIGYIECKDINTNLTQEAKTEQIKKRYLPGLYNFILTDYIEFRWYVGQEVRLTARMAEEGAGGKFKLTDKGVEKVGELLGLFLRREPERISSAKDLAVRMAGLARLLRDITKRTFEQETKTGPLHTQLEAFRKVLLHGLTEEQFADMYAQAIAYGLFAAWCHLEGVTVFGKDRYAAFHGMDLKAEQLTREHAAYLLPKTNPFLRKIFGQIVGPELDDRLVWVVDDLVELLREAKMDSVLKGFGKRGGRSDPVVHFYETFLREYDPKLRELRGVYYTPDEVVSYIVRSVDWLLKEKFGLRLGLADESKVMVNGQKVDRVLILDPAVGTGTFLFEVIEQIYKRFRRQKGMWSGYVKEHLLPRIFGFEFMMAPYAIAHTRLGLELADLGYDFESDERLGIYLTNTLEEAQKISENVFVQGLSEEATEANKVKKDLPIMVVLGNPPYSGHSANRSWKMEGGKRVPTFIGRLVKDYYEVDGQPLGEKNPKWLQDDYVKFIRFGQWRIEHTGMGILAFITNHGYLDNPTFRGMRQQLMKVFSKIYVLDLHGNLKKKEVCPDGSKDVNVFDIQQGVSIGIFVKEEDREGTAKVYHSEFWGLRKAKSVRLLKEEVETTEWNEITPQRPFYLFKPQDVSLLDEYEKGRKINEIMQVNSVGIVTSRDDFVIDLDENKLKKRIAEFLDSNVSNETIKRKYKLKEKKKWLIENCRNKLQEDKTRIEEYIENCLYRIFDIRKIFYHDCIIERTRCEIMRHMVNKNIGLITVRRVPPSNECCYFMISTNMISNGVIRSDNQSIDTFFPLYLYPKTRDVKQGDFLESSHWPPGRNGRVPNLSPEFVEEFAEKVKLGFVSDGVGDLKKTFGPEDIFHFIYGIFHSLEYRRRYAEFLKIDFPRVPMPKTKMLFQKLCKVGEKLVKLHLVESEILEDERRWPSFDIAGDNTVEKGYPKYVAHADAPKKGKVYINKEQYFEGVRPDVWEFHIGGYQVCKKWLKDRKERKLSYEDISHYQKIIVALGETIRLMNETCLSEMFQETSKE